MADDKKSIGKEDVEYLGLLARIRLSEEEMDSFAKEFEKILDYVSTLSSIDTERVESSYNIIKKNMVLREDRTEESMDRSEILSNAPEKTDRFFKVPKII